MYTYLLHFQSWLDLKNKMNNPSSSLYRLKLQEASHSLYNINAVSEQKDSKNWKLTDRCFEFIF